MDFQAVFAQQRGDVTAKEFQLAGGTQEGLVQDAELVLDDAGYVKGQFFYLVEPSRLAGAPWVDVLSLRAEDAPAAYRPNAGGTIQLYRDERLSPASGQQSAQLGYFLANATPPGGGPRHSGTFRRLIPEQDYTVHSSGLWVMLRSPLRADEALALSYVTESGDTIGTYDAEQAPAGVTPELLLLRGPVTQHQPGTGTWPMELHQVYRLDSSSDVDASDVELSISLGEAAGGRTFRDVNGRQVSFLRLFGLDEDAPSDRLDLAQVWQPGQGGEDASGQQSIGGTFIIFPALQPFLDPAGITSEGLSAAQVKDVLGRDANAAIYEEVDPVRRETSARFRLSFTYRVAVQGLVSSFNLGSVGIREESERIRLGERLLERDVDYTIDYDIGQVNLLDAATLFGANPGAQLRATWEQKPLFEIAPTSVFGLNTRFRLGARDTLDLVGLYQAEKTLMSRPQLRTAGSIFLGGASLQFRRCAPRSVPRTHPGAAHGGAEQCAAHG
jgi:cell surface protein SprA